MKTNRSWSVAILLLLPMIAPAAEDSKPPEVATCTAGCDYIEIDELIERVAKRTGKQFIVDPRVRATIPLIGMDVAKVDYERLLAILNVHNFAAFQSGGIVRVVPDANARQLPIRVTTEIKPGTLDDELVTLVIQPKNICAAQTVPILRPMMPQAAHLAAFPPTNTLLIVDTAANARRLLDVLERLDRQAAAAKLSCNEIKPAAN